ncbi:MULTISPECIES: NUDIX domain-containing protein [Pseudonocardia]|uniref:RNA pyrophosphohydrolase n=2 Tax=Pseudonocardia TaxID=1847 RepID=A0A1Y2N5U5_PSEAH|nr:MULTISPECIES: NUDIX domain-containing protein [Pseudonocardia]OSY42844.1 RNA pyrophosphohydrolase [Pseudonocardia autotrophica]TDN77421.1 putative NUDIX family NTP pyrophosphohydrolase [Pseudonocardia autotrophica]BBG01445.1 DNA mismatch repair protein MutT [Pseudonocardia autotrophica]GEC24502.1 DNA mismatch repair protein MutT [Pseudonocardia saturnea]
MPPVTSAGLLLHRNGPEGIEVLLGHMGGPFWARKEHAWTVPKGEHGPDETPFDAARREFTEEIGTPPPDGEPVELGSVRQSRKIVSVFAVDGTGFDGADAVAARPDDGSWVEIEWPPRSGRRLRFPELDRARWCDLATARERIVVAQQPFLDRLERLVAG